MRVLITRPKDDAQGLAQALADLGVESVSAPLLDIAYEDGPALDLDGVQAVLLTSANGVRALARRTDVRTILALCVGDATRREAEQAGFERVKSAGGDVADLARLVQETCTEDGGALLHAAGSKVAGDLAGLLAGYTYRREVLYHAQKATHLPERAKAELESAKLDGVVLYSPRTAQAFVKLAEAEGLAPALERVTAYCLSQAVAREVEPVRWANICVAAQPDQPSMLALLKG